CSGGLYRKKVYKSSFPYLSPTISYSSFEGVCKPYPLHPCGRHKDQPYYGECTKRTEDTPVCRRSCQLTCPKSYQEDKIYALSGYDVLANETAIQKEIMKNGPVQAGMTVYSDLYLYEEGIYRRTWGADVGTHVVKLIGWGVSPYGTKYWLVANSWNFDWGEEGYFRILRGTNECNIESNVFAGVMKV
ncbi:papain family cysteine protease, partial [Oesophagostomum dentatum]